MKRSNRFQLIWDGSLGRCDGDGRACACAGRLELADCSYPWHVEKWGGQGSAERVRQGPPAPSLTPRHCNVPWFRLCHVADKPNGLALYNYVSCWWPSWQHHLFYYVNSNFNSNSSFTSCSRTCTESHGSPQGNKKRHFSHGCMRDMLRLSACLKSCTRELEKKERDGIYSGPPTNKPNPQRANRRKY